MESMAEHTRSNDLIEECQGLVRFLARQLKSRLPSWIELDDLIGYGQVGLMQAARDFDEARGAKFSTFAYYRIRGAIHDGVNKMMWFRAVRDPEATYNQAADDYINSDSKDRSAAGESESEDLSSVASWFSRSVGALAVSYLASADGSDRASEVVDQSAEAPWSGILQQETHSKLVEAIDQLPPESAALIRAVYYSGQSLQEAKSLEQLARHLKRSDIDGTLGVDGNPTGGLRL